MKYKRDAATGCWIWLGTVNNKGYGKTFEVNGQWRRSIYAHRLAWIMRNGPIADKLCVLHRCDTPSCINPDHLFLGTQKDNAADRDRKGRGTAGEKNGMAKLDAESVVSIRADSRKQREIAESYGVTQQAVSRIKSRIAWASL
jgi:hypothetical protein